MVAHPMKLLVFAHVPPPHHGQSYMVKLMLERFGGDTRKRSSASPPPPEGGIECYHVDSRYSDDLEDIGSFRVVKAWLVVRYCVAALWCRFRYGVEAFYYVPAPGKRAALYRDWIVMALCRPFFRHFVYHWHAGGLGDWLEEGGGTWWERWLTHRLLAKASLSIALSIPGMRDALWFRTQRVETVANGIPDPCPDFDKVLLPKRQERLAARTAATEAPANTEPHLVKLLYLAHCTRSKGLFDTLEAVAVAIAELKRRGTPIALHLSVAGAFFIEEEEREFNARIAEPDLRDVVVYLGFVTGEAKDRLLRESDFLCFPTFYEAEAQPVNLIEGMAFGLPAVTTRWRGIPDLLPSDYQGLVPTHAPASVATALLQLFEHDYAESLRQHFVANYTAERHAEALQKAILRLDDPGLAQTPPLSAPC